MALPAGLSTVTVSGTYLTPDGRPRTGGIRITPEPAVLTSATHGVIVLGTTTVTPDVDGRIEAVLLATDDPDVTPTGWTYRVEERWYDRPGRGYPLSLPSAAPEVDLAKVAPTAPSAGEYLLVTGPAGPAGPAGEDAPRWRRAQLPSPVDAFGLHTGAAPTISNAQTATPTSGYILHRPPGVALAGTDVAGQFAFRGATGVAPIGATGTEPTYVMASSRWPGTTSSQNVYAVEFGTDAATIQIRHRHMTASAGYRLHIDGRPLTDHATITPGTGPGNTNLMTIAFGSAAPRTIRIETYYMPFGGVYVPPTASIWNTPARGGRLAVLGDSISDGSDQNTASGAGTWVYRAGRALGATDIWEQGRGGTGYTVAGSSATFVDRVGPDIVNHNPDRVIIWGGANDSDNPQPDIADAAATVYAAITSGLPGADTYIIGCWDRQGTAAAAITATDATLRAAAADAGLPFISPVTGSIYDPAGTLVATQGPWLRPGQTATYIGADGVHPNDTGHAYLARRITAAITALMPA